MSESAQSPESIQPKEGQDKPTVQERTNAFFNRLLNTNIATKVTFGSTVLLSSQEFLQGNFGGVAVRMGIGTAASV